MDSVCAPPRNLRDTHWHKHVRARARTEAVARAVEAVLGARRVRAGRASRHAGGRAHLAALLLYSAGAVCQCRRAAKR
eukprot:5847129-Prymnesium_polylepis.1